MKLVKYVLSALFLTTIPALVLGGDVVGIAKPWQLNFQEPASPVMQRLFDMHWNLTILITVISVFVLALMVLIVVKFREKKNPTPSKTTHNTFIEIV